MRGWWGGWGSNPRPADYEKPGPALRVRYLHRYRGAVPPMALIALFAPTARSTHSMVITGCQLQNVNADSAADAIGPAISSNRLPPRGLARPILLLDVRGGGLR